MDYYPIDYVSIGKKIRKCRKEKHLTQAELAELINRSLSFVGHIERGTRIISLETFLNIVQALDCSADHLLGTSKEEKQAHLSAERILQIAADLAAKEL